MRCPTCKKEVSEPAPSERSRYPFCCERCKLIDLGRWFDGKYQIPVRETDPEHAVDESPDPDDEAE